MDWQLVNSKILAYIFVDLENFLLINSKKLKPKLSYEGRKNGQAGRTAKIG